jgi:hypothetical protein
MCATMLRAKYYLDGNLLDAGPTRVLASLSKAYKLVTFNFQKRPHMESGQWAMADLHWDQCGQLATQEFGKSFVYKHI